MEALSSIDRLRGIVPSGDFKRAAAFDGLVEAISIKGGDPLKLLAKFGLHPDLFEQPDAYVSYPAVIRLLEYCARELDAPHLGLEIGAAHKIDALGPIVLLLSACRNIGEALGNLSQFIYVHSPGATLTISTEGGQARLAYRIKNPALTASRQINELSMATAFKALQNLADQHFRLNEVHFVSSCSEQGDAAVQHFFSAAIMYEQDVSALVFPERILSNSLSLDTSSAMLLAQEVLETMAPQDSQDIVTRSEELIQRLLPLGICNVETLSQNFGMSGRALQYHFKARGVDFRSLLRGQREQLAKGYLTTTNTPIAHIATLLGYADQAVFTRAFAGWTGTSPARYRKLNALK